MKLLLAGYYGCGNLGDEAILEPLLSGIRNIFPASEITVLSGDPAETSRCYDVAAIKRSSFFDVIRAIRNCDALILGGGGLLQDATSLRSLRYYLSLISMAKFFKKKVALLGQGIGPVRNRRLLKRKLKNIDLITVRDEGSLKELTQIGVAAKKLALTADLAFLLDVQDKEKAKKLLEIDGVVKCRQCLIGVSVRSLIKGKSSDRTYKMIASMCDRLIKEKDCQIVFLIFKYPDDIETANKVMGHMKYPAHVFFRQCRPSDMLSVISVMDAVIGMRLHSLIFAARSGVPALGLSYDPKVSAFQRSIGQPYLEMSSLKEDALKIEADRLFEHLNQKPINIDHIAAKARDNLILLNELLSRDRIRILGIDIDNVSMDEAAKKVEELLKKRDHNLIATPNPEMIMAAQKDIDLRNIINNAALAPSDGIGLMIAARILGRKFKERVAGIDLMMEMIKIAKKNSLRVFLFGGREGVAEEAARNLEVDVAGTFHGYSMNNTLVISRIKEAKPDILFVGLGSPKQEKWASRHLRELNVPLVMCVGGSLDVLSGKMKRAPAFMRRSGLEWLYRLIREPGRWRRMATLPVFIMKVIKQRLLG
jgi:N-acetylglucosaminyldiphosphoundecaprenol N-acetyl-beta-D-mannosaminyltransferase